MSWLSNAFSGGVESIVDPVKQDAHFIGDVLSGDVHSGWDRLASERGNMIGDIADLSNPTVSHAGDSARAAGADFSAHPGNAVLTALGLAYGGTPNLSSFGGTASTGADTFDVGAAEGAGGIADGAGGTAGATAGAGTGGVGIIGAADQAPNLLSPETASLLGIDSASLFGAPSAAPVTGVGGDLGLSGTFYGGGAGAGVGDATALGSGGVSDFNYLSPSESQAVDPAMAGTKATADGALPWYIKHLPSEIGGLNAFMGLGQKPKLNDQFKQELASAQAVLPGAQATFKSGGTASPNWTQQKTTIDTSIDQQIKQNTSDIQQKAVNSGMGADSAVVQQQIQTMKANAETQRQQLYLQAQQQNVQDAVSVMTNANNILESIGAYQAQQDQAIKNQIGQSSLLAAELFAKGY